ncbi:glycoside hydrolase family 16 protein [Actinocorallia sp. B10E7]|uniref:glycoside hydrolase family 16 protein n=1 Tax=Actinocorallia sp. B10E7 TaxID=3153558 RepID=UPI00325D17DD
MPRPATVLAVCGLLALSTLPVLPAEAKAAPKWKLVWSDEFRGKKNTPPNSRKWYSQTGDRNGWGVGGLAYYDPANAKQNGAGRLLITAQKDNGNTQCYYGPCEYRSARLQTAERFMRKYGRFTARIKFPVGQGVFPAFWLQTRNTKYGTKKYAEIDIAEIVGARTRNVYGAAHQTKQVAGFQKVLNKPVSAGYHVYGVDWTPGSIRWWVDGKVYGTLKRYKGWSFDQRLQIILNVQIGGDWQGPPNADTGFPATMAVDWVRVYQPKRLRQPVP